MSKSSEEIFADWVTRNVAPNKAPNRPATPPLVERVAIMMAVGNNGGSWNINYTQEQRERWVRKASEVIGMIEAELFTRQQEALDNDNS